jgi:hypothetical protein
MLKHWCDRAQPLALFFDLCEEQNPCQNGGRCVSKMPNYDDPSYQPEGLGQIDYHCDCPIHIVGDHCQEEMYPLGYCLNGGTFLHIVHHANRSSDSCLCARGFRGEHCEEDIDNCQSVDCSGNGICIDGVDSFQCSCFDGFSGLLCQRSTMQQTLIKVVNRSFGIIAIVIIASIVCLVVISDLHTYWTQRRRRNNLLKQSPHLTTQMLENSVLLLSFRDTPIEMYDLSRVNRRRRILRASRTKSRTRRQIGYRNLSREPTNNAS